MISWLQRLLDSAEALGHPGARLDYPEVIRIERALFWVARSIAASYVNHSLVGFSNRSRSALESRLRTDGVRRDVAHVLRQSFTVVYTLKAASSANPYAKGEILAELAEWSRLEPEVARALKRFVANVELLEVTPLRGSGRGKRRLDHLPPV